MEKRELDLSGRAAIVTGAAQGIGRAITMALAANGCKVLGVDINPDALKKLDADAAAELGQGRVATAVADVSKIADIEKAVDSCAEAFGGVDIVVNNAGILHSTPVEEITEEEWDRMMAINLKGVFFFAQKSIPYMKKKKWGRIINMSSLAGRMGGYANGLAYSASKAAIIGLSQGMARRIAEHNITVNAVAPGTTESDIIKQFSEEQKNKLRAMIPLGHLGAVEDIADLVLFLSSDLSGFITGAVIDINGGMYMG